MTDTTKPATPELDSDYAYAVRLATSMREKHYPEVPQWRPLESLYGVLSQIDNMTTGLVRAATPAATDERIPEGWVPLRITHAPGEDPEDVAFGPQPMMDRLQKWLGRYFAKLERGKIAAATDERELFEAAFEERFPVSANTNPFLFMLREGEYADSSVGVGWWMWQAARAQLAAPQAVAGIEPEGLTVKQAWWAGYRHGKGLPPEIPRTEALAEAHGKHELSEVDLSLITARHSEQDGAFRTHNPGAMCREAIAADRCLRLGEEAYQVGDTKDTARLNALDAARDRRARDLNQCPLWRVRDDDSSLSLHVTEAQGSGDLDKSLRVRDAIDAWRARQ